MTDASPAPAPDPVDQARALTSVATLALLADVGIYYFTLQPLLSAFGVPPKSTAHPGMIPALAIQYGIRVAAAAAFAGWLLWKRHATSHDLGLTFRNFKSDAIWTIKVILALCGITAVLMAIAIPVIRASGLKPDLGQDLHHWPVALLCAPIAEEFVYRSLLVPGLRAGYSRRETVVVSGVIFYLLHLGYGYDWTKFHYVVAGMLLSWVYLQRPRLWICALLHFGGNVLVMLDDILLKVSPETYKAILGYLPK